MEPQVVRDQDPAYSLRREIRDIVLANAGTLADLLLVGISSRMGGKNISIPKAAPRPTGAANRAAPDGQPLQDVQTPAQFQLEFKGKYMTPQQAPQTLADLVNEVARLTAAGADAYELYPVKAAASLALARRADEIGHALAERVSADESIQALLVDLFLVTHLAVDRDLHPHGLSSGVNWLVVLETFFPIPSNEQLNAREPAFRAEHGLPLVAKH